MLTQRFLQLLHHILEFARIFGSYGPGDQSLDAVLEATLWQVAILYFAAARFTRTVCAWPLHGTPEIDVAFVSWVQVDVDLPSSSTLEGLTAP